MHYLKHFWVFLCWMLLIIYLSFTPLNDWPQPSVLQKLYLDKVVHFTMYLVLSLLLLRSFYRQQNRQMLRYAVIITALLFSAGLGIAVETLQPLLTRFRKFEWADMAANVAGALAGVLIFRRWIFTRQSIAKN